VEEEMYNKKGNDNSFDTNNKSIAIISHVNPLAKGSGQIQRVYNTLLALASNWDNITLYTINNGSSTDRLDRLTAINQNFKVVYVKKPIYLKYVSPIFHFLFYLGYGKPSNWLIPLIFKRLKKTIEKEGYDVILFEYWHLYKLALKIKTPSNYIVCDTHNILLNTYQVLLNSKKWMPDFYKNYLLKRYKQLEFNKALKSFDMLVAINREEEALLNQKFHNKNIYYFPMGVILPEIESRDKKKFKQQKEKFVIVYYGGLGNEKNKNDALKVLDVIDFLNKGDIIIQYKIIGSNPPESLKKRVADNPHVLLLGYVENLQKAFEDVDMAVIPFSGRYGFRSRLIELMFYDIPVLTTQDAVWGMGFKHNNDIFLFDDKQDYSDYLLNLLKDVQLRKKIVLNANKRVNNEFTFENTYVKFAKMLTNIDHK
jgi:glycosyltransferase involved in cell wall biosynthesis